LFYQAKASLTIRKNLERESHQHLVINDVIS
jgi:hypothetical protein